MNHAQAEKIRAAVAALKPDAVSLLQELVRIPSENNPPHGNEKAVQKFYHGWLRQHGIESSLYYPLDIPGFDAYPGRLSEHDMSGRPNVAATFPGSGGGRSLLLLAHADVVPVGPREAWDDNPFSGKIRDGRLYGRGSGDDKCGMAIAAILPLALRSAGVRLAGDLTIAAVADEEAGGGNGTAALLASGTKADAAVYLDGSNQTIWNTGLGGGFAEVSLTAGSRQELDELTAWTRETIAGLKQERKRAIVEHPDFGGDFFRNDAMHGFFDILQCDPDAHGAQLTFFLDTLPGEDEEDLKRHAESALQSRPLRAGEGLQINWMSRFLKAAPAMPREHPLVSELSRSFKTAAGRDARVGPGRQSDQGLVSYFGNMSCVLFGCGRRGQAGAPHLPNEYILLKEFEENLLTMALMLANWCGTETSAK